MKPPSWAEQDPAMKVAIVAVGLVILAVVVACLAGVGWWVAFLWCLAVGRD